MELRNMISKLQNITDLKRESTEKRLFEKYNTKGGLKTVTEELKQRVVAKGEKVKRYLIESNSCNRTFFSK